MKTVAILLCAGTGKRAAQGEPKQFVQIHGRPVWRHSFDRFMKSGRIDEILIVTLPDFIDELRTLTGTDVITGGERRQDSVFNGLSFLKSRLDKDDVVLVHDSARPFFTQKLLDTLLDTLEKGADAVIPGIPVKDTIKAVQSGVVKNTLDRSELRAIQTPQVFRFGMMMDCHERARRESFKGTDDAMLAEKYGHSVVMVPGEEKNRKMTTEKDFEDITGKRSASSMIRTGFGYDSHRLVEGRDLVLGGIRIPFEKGLDGHSDADVLVHAIIDSLLGAAALGDIGQHFPDTDSEFKDADSCRLLEKTAALVSESGFSICHIDATVILQNPKLAPHIPEIRNKISNVLHLDPTCLSVKAKTNEGMGATGRGEGVVTFAVATLCHKNPQ